MPPTSIELPLRGPSGEPVSLRRTLASHGVAGLPPARIDEARGSLETTLAVAPGRVRMLRISPGRPGRARIDVAGRAPGARERAAVIAAVGRLLNLDEDLAPFYERVASDPDLAWAADGAGRMVRSLTVFEDVVKTICTTNCAWSGTIRMVTALVEHLGERAPGAPASGTTGRAFPTAAEMASADEAFYRDVARAGYRGAYLRSLAGSVADGSVDLETLAQSPRAELSDAEVAERLLALPGVGPYAAAHIMMLLGRHSMLVLDSWTRPTYARLAGRKRVADSTITRRFRRYRKHAGLAFWLFLTRDWVPEPAAIDGG